MRKSGNAPTVPLTEDGGLPLLNYSQIAEWNRCRYRYNLSTLRHVQSRAVLRAMDLGSALHAGMEAAMRTMLRVAAKPSGSAKAPSVEGRIKSAVTVALTRWADEQIALRGGREQLTEEEIEGIQHILNCGGQITQRAIEYLGPKRWRTVTVGKAKRPGIELAVQTRLPVKGWGGFHCTIDWIVEDLTEGGIWVADYKFRGQFTPMEAEEVNLQLAIYQYVLLAKYGLETSGTMMFQGRNTPPAQPTVNKNGSMSRARIATDWPTYEAALESAGLDPKDYESEMRLKLDYEFFRLDKMYRSMDEAQAIWDQIVIPAGKSIIRDRQDPTRMWRHLSYMNCNGCWARDFCLTELRGEDTDFLLKTRYIDLDNPQERLVLAPEDLVMED